MARVSLSLPCLTLATQLRYEARNVRVSSGKDGEKGDLKGGKSAIKRTKDVRGLAALRVVSLFECAERVERGRKRSKTT